MKGIYPPLLYIPDCSYMLKLGVGEKYELVKL